MLEKIKVELLEMYEKNLKEGSRRLIEVPEPTDIEIGQIREIWMIPPERFLVLEKVNDNLYLTVPLTSYIQLLPEDAPLYCNRYSDDYKILLGVVPVWDYVKADIIKRYSKVIGRVRETEIQKIKSYIEKKDRNYPWEVKRFIRLNSKVWSMINMHSILSHVDEIENSEEDKQVIYLEEKEVKDDAGIFYQKTENAYVVISKDIIRIYTQIESVGKHVRIKINGKVVYSGEVESARIEIIGSFIGNEKVEVEIID